jgi:membrane protein implicated in regulation of membrane protease activity
LSWAGIVNPEWVQWLTFAALSLLSMFTFRKAIYVKIRGDVPGFNDGVSGGYLVVQDELAPGKQTRASFRGSEWTVVNAGETTIAAGERARIEKSEGLTLHVSSNADQQ